MSVRPSRTGSTWVQPLTNSPEPGMVELNLRELALKYRSLVQSQSEPQSISY